MRFLFALIFLATAVQAQINPKNITIARDSFGVPHIFAKTDPEVSYGLAWAHAEDDFRSLQLVALPAKGLMAKALGKERRNAQKARGTSHVVKTRMMKIEEHVDDCGEYLSSLKGVELCS
jgi:acyl-homoserine-lactone acylase